MPPTLLALLGFLTWTLLLLAVMEAVRVKIVASDQVPANGFNPENSNLSPFMQRLARAHANCIEGLPLFGGLMLLAVVAGRAGVTDSLAYVFLTARIVQSSVHVVSTSVPAVNLRFAAFVVQLGIATYWVVRLCGA